MSDNTGDNAGLEDLQDRIGYRFRDPSLLEAALTHRSYRYEHSGAKMDNQRLEFLGDAVLGFVVSVWLYRSLDGDEGVLTEARSRYIRGSTLGSLAAELDLGRHMRLGVGEKRARGHERASTLSDAMEAVIGAVYLDGGLRACARVVRRFLFLAGPSGDQGGGIHNPKGLLQQASQALWRKGPEYKVLEMTGPSHDRRFCVGVALPDGTAASGTGASRRGAEVCAATEALKLLVERGVIPDPSPKDGK